MRPPGPRADWIELGVIARPHGVGGDVRVHVFNSDSKLLEELGEVFLQGDDGEPPSLVEVASTRRAPKALLMRFAGVASLEDADALRGYRLCVPRALLPDLEDGEYYHADLVGLEAYHQGQAIGKVVEVLDYPSVECLKVQTEEGIREVPMLPNWVERIELDAGRVYLATLDDVPVQKVR